MITKEFNLEYNCHNPVLRLDELISGGYEARKIGSSWFLTRSREKHSLEFALVDLSDSNADGTGIRVSVLFHGWGVTGLRELRHVWWGDDEGYTFYPNMLAIGEAIKLLSEWFDVGGA